MGADHDGVSGLATGCLLRCSGVTNIISLNGGLSKFNQPKRQSPVRGSAMYRHSADSIFCLIFRSSAVYRALKSCMRLLMPGQRYIVDEVTQRN
jgi:hypothetical protein